MAAIAGAETAMPTVSRLTAARPGAAQRLAALRLGRGGKLTGPHGAFTILSRAWGSGALPGMAPAGETALEYIQPDGSAPGPVRGDRAPAPAAAESSRRGARGPFPERTDGLSPAAGRGGRLSSALSPESAAGPGPAARVAPAELDYLAVPPAGGAASPVPGEKTAAPERTARPGGAAGAAAQREGRSAPGQSEPRRTPAGPEARGALRRGPETARTAASGDRSAALAAELDYFVPAGPETGPGNGGRAGLPAVGAAPAPGYGAPEELTYAAQPGREAPDAGPAAPGQTGARTPGRAERRGTETGRASAPGPGSAGSRARNAGPAGRTDMRTLRPLTVTPRKTAGGYPAPELALGLPAAGPAGGSGAPLPAESPEGERQSPASAMAAKSAPESMSVLDKFAAPAVTEQIVWQNPYLRTPPVNTTLRQKDRSAAESAPGRTESRELRMNDAELRRTADKVYQLVEERIRRERRRMGL